MTLDKVAVRAGTTPLDWTRLAFYVSLAVAILGGLVYVVLGWEAFPEATPDMDAYRLGAERILAGKPLYLELHGPLTYRYAPWLAIVWMPLSLSGIGNALWLLATAGAAVYIIVATARMGGPAAAVLAALALPLLGAVPHANVGTLLAALLLWRRADPWSVGIAGSLKIYPLILCAGYIAERRWRDLGIALGVAGVLWLPALAFDLSGYPSPQGEVGLFSGTTLLLVSAGVGVTLALLAWQGSRWTWVASAVAVPLVVPHYASALPFLLAVTRRLR